MAHTLTLSLLAAAPDRRTAEVMAEAALQQGADADQLRAAWTRWQHNHDEAQRRGEA